MEISELIEQTKRQFRVVSEPEWHPFDRPYYENRCLIGRTRETECTCGQEVTGHYAWGSPKYEQWVGICIGCGLKFRFVSSGLVHSFGPMDRNGFW